MTKSAIKGMKGISTGDKVLKRLRSMIANGDFNESGMLPPERKLAENLGVGRLLVRDAIRKLEVLGIVTTVPQSGTRINGMGTIALEGLLSNILKIEETDFASIVNTRIILEIESAGIAALNRTEKDIKLITSALEEHENKIMDGLPASDADLQLHLAIAEVSGNTVLKALMRIITPDTMISLVKPSINNLDRQNNLLKEHREIVDNIIARNQEGAKAAMKNHLRGIAALANI